MVNWIQERRLKCNANEGVEPHLQARRGRASCLQKHTKYLHTLYTIYFIHYLLLKSEIWVIQRILTLRQGMFFFLFFFYLTENNSPILNQRMPKNVPRTSIFWTECTITTRPNKYSTQYIHWVCKYQIFHRVFSNITHLDQCGPG